MTIIDILNKMLEYKQAKKIAKLYVLQDTVLDSSLTPDEKETLIATIEIAADCLLDS